MGFGFRAMLEIAALPALIVVSVAARCRTKPIDVGLGPEPLVNNIYHKKALESFGYLAQTFASHVYFITDRFDVLPQAILQRMNWVPGRIQATLFSCVLFAMTVFRYKCVYLYFSGGPLGLSTLWLWRIEPLLYRLANTTVVVMPYGSDIQEMSRSPNLLFKHALAQEYRSHRLRRGRIAENIDLWTRWADHVISGCEWVYYMYHWDTLMIAHFSIDVETWKPLGGDSERINRSGALRILHAPNHRMIKGSQRFIDSVNELRDEGVEVELVILEKVPNDHIRDVMASVDVIADQLVVGWYAMFAIEGMAMGKPVLCYLRDDLEELFIHAGLLERGEIPIVRCSSSSVKEEIRRLASDRQVLREIGKRSREYVLKHHSTEAVGRIFDGINRSIGVRAA